MEKFLLSDNSILRASLAGVRGAGGGEVWEAPLGSLRACWEADEWKVYLAASPALLCLFQGKFPALDVKLLIFPL